MKKIFGLFFSFILTLSLFSTSAFAAEINPLAEEGPPGGGGGSVFTYPNTNNTQAMLGDILITNSSSSSGLIGHSAIVVSGTQVVHIAGYGYSPTIITLQSFFQRYPSTKVIRMVPDASKGLNPSNAASWALNYVSNHGNATYGIANSLLDLNETYCSKIVWQSFYFTGCDIVKANQRGVGSGGQSWEFSTVTPYELATPSYSYTTYLSTWN